MPSHDWQLHWFPLLLHLTSRKVTSRAQHRGLPTAIDHRSFVRLLKLRRHGAVSKEDL
jgi:hypothetical protein